MRLFVSVLSHFVTRGAASKFILPTARSSPRYPPINSAHLVCSDSELISDFEQKATPPSS